MRFENIKPILSKDQESEQDLVKKESVDETLLGKIRKKTGAVTKGLILVGGLSLSSCKFDKYAPGIDPAHQPSELALRFNENILSEKEYFKLCQDNPEKAFVVSPLYRNKDWVTASLEQAAKSDPIQALQYASRYQNNPDYDSIISIAIDALEEHYKEGYEGGGDYPISPHYILNKHISAWINTSRAREILEARHNNFLFFLNNFKEISKSEVGRKIAIKEIKLASEFAPILVLQNLSQYLSEPWAEEVVKTAALKEPATFFDNIFLISNYNESNKESLDKLIIEVANSRPDEAVFGILFSQWATSLSDIQETEDGKKFMALLENSHNKNLELIPVIRKKFISGEVNSIDGRKLALLLDNISSGGITMEEALKIVQNKTDYFKRLINIVENPGHPVFDVAEEYITRDILRAVRIINNLHEYSDKERFASIEHSDAKELYFMLSYGEEEIFTSSFNGIFDHLITCLKNEKLSGYQLLEQENFIKFRTFIRICTEFGRWDDFLSTMNPTEQKDISRLFITGIDKAKDPLREAVSIAEVMSLTKNPSDLELFEKEVQQQIRCMKKTDKLEMELLYKLIAASLLRESGNSGWLQEIEKTYKLPSLSQVKSSELFSQNAFNIQEYFFYNDEDGKSSFVNFLDKYRNDKGWAIEDKGTYVMISSYNNEHGIRIYANKPEAEEGGPEEIAAELKKQNVATSVFVHRGHSYHAQKTIKRIPVTAKIVSLGSCGGYRNISKVLETAPNAHVISTKGIGTKHVNDPLFKMLNEEILSGRDIVWSAFWKKAEQKIKNDKFDYYVAPNENFGAIFIKVYNQMLQNKDQFEK